jgi:hypothetical protein
LSFAGVSCARDHLLGVALARLKGPLEIRRPRGSQDVLGVKGQEIQAQPDSGVHPVS